MIGIKIFLKYLASWWRVEVVWYECVVVGRVCTDGIVLSAGGVVLRKFDVFFGKSELQTF